VVIFYHKSKKITKIELIYVQINKYISPDIGTLQKTVECVHVAVKTAS